MEQPDLCNFIHVQLGINPLPLPCGLGLTHFNLCTWKEDLVTPLSCFFLNLC